MIAEYPVPQARLGKDANIVARTKPADKFRTYRLLGHAQKLLIEAETKSRSGNVHRTRLCHNVRAFQAETITLKIPSAPELKNASLSGVQTCGSVWSCPVCAKRIATQRGNEISQAIDKMIASGHVPIMITNTARHDLQFHLKPFKNAFKEAHRYFVQSRRWRELKAQLGIEHNIKAVEATYTLENGWHYHQHAILFVQADALKMLEPEALETWKIMARDLWLDALERYGLSGTKERAFHVQASGDVKRDYLAKLGLENESSNLDYELSSGHNKTRGGLKIWQILERAWQGSEQHAALYIEFVEAMSGDNWITWSHGLKELCAIGEIEDEQAAAADGSESFEQIPLMQISDDEFLPVRKLHALADLLQLAANTRSEVMCRDFLRTLATEWNNSGAGAERSRMELQFKIVQDRFMLMRKHWNHIGQHAPEDHEFWKLAKQMRELAEKLEIKL